LPFEELTAFPSLSPEDQNKIRLAISLRRVDPADIPYTARVNIPPSTIPVSAPTTAPATQMGQKRTSTQAGLTARPSVASAPSHSQANVEVEKEITEEEVRDELYCTMNTNVVGIQYYRGVFVCSSPLLVSNLVDLGLVGPGEEVLLVREPHNQYDRYVSTFEITHALTLFEEMRFRSKTYLEHK